MKMGARILGALAGLLLLFLGVGLLLPGRWQAEVEETLPAPPEAVFHHLDSPASWQGWSPMPETGLTSFGPPRGEGSGLRWDDPRYGRGEVVLTECVPRERVAYRVEVEGGSLLYFGTFQLTPAAGGTRIHWRETGDFGWNPLTRYAARFMRGSQARAMEAGLERLARLLAEEGSEP